MKYIIIFLNLFFCTVLFSQDQQTDCASSIMIGKSVENFKVYKYPKDSKSLKLNDINEVNNETPEGLMSSILSASDLTWYNYNREEKKQKTSQDFDYIKKASLENYYFELLYKVSFNANGLEYAVIKYYLHDKDKEPIGFAEAIKKIGDKWVTTSEAEISQLLFFMVMIDVEFIDSIFNNSKSNNDSLNTILAEKSINSSVDINGVLNELQKRLSENDEKIKLILDANRLFK